MKRKLYKLAQIDFNTTQNLLTSRSKSSALIASILANQVNWFGAAGQLIRMRLSSERKKDIIENDFTNRELDSFEWKCSSSPLRLNLFLQ